MDKNRKFKETDKMANTYTQQKKNEKNLPAPKNFHFNFQSTPATLKSVVREFSSFPSFYYPVATHLISYTVRRVVKARHPYIHLLPAKRTAAFSVLFFDFTVAKSTERIFPKCHILRQT